ncbi:MAG: GntR family transcriptional regulator [Rhizobium sp.]
MRDPTADQQSETTRVARCIEEDIIFGRIEPGAALREERLLARFGVSRHIVRAALALLEHDGIVIRELNRGARVRTFSAAEVKELHEVREVLQRHAALRIRLPVEQSEIEKLEEIESRYETAVETGDLRGMQDINSEFHRGVFALCGNAHLCNMIADLLHVTFPVRANSLGDKADRQRAIADHRLILSLLSGNDSWALAEVCVNHIKARRDAYLEFLEKDHKGSR